MKTVVTLDLRKWLTVVLMTFFTAAVMASTVAADDVVLGQVAPDFTARTVTGKTFQLSKQAGQTVLLTFWSTWCSLNREELAFLRQLEDSYPDLVFVIVDAGSVQPNIKSLAQVWQAVEEWALSAVVIPDKGLELTGRYGVQALPTSLVVDSEGRVAHVEPNFFWPDQERVTRSLEGKSAVSLLLEGAQSPIGN